MGMGWGKCQEESRTNLDRGFSRLDGGGEEVQVAGGEAGAVFFLLFGRHGGRGDFGAGEGGLLDWRRMVWR